MTAPRRSAAANAARILSAHPAYGTVDETDAAIGVVRLHLAEARELDGMLGRIQNDLFDLGADLAVPSATARPTVADAPKPGPTARRDIDALNSICALTSFVLPGRTPAAAYLHLAGTICRRAERIMVELAANPEEPVSEAAIHYMNRLSDFLFVASRAMNDNGAGDVLWCPAKPLRFPCPGLIFGFRALTADSGAFRFRAQAMTS